MANQANAVVHKDVPKDVSQGASRANRPCATTFHSVDIGSADTQRQHLVRFKVSVDVSVVVHVAFR